MQSHPIGSDDLNAYVDGQLSPERRAQVEMRIAQDPELRIELDDLRTTSRLLASLPELTPRRSFVLGAEHLKSPPVAKPGKVIQLLPIVRTLSIAAALVFMVVGGSLFFDINGNPDDNTSQTFQEQNEIMGNSGVTESDGEASGHAEGANEPAAPAAADESSQPASEDNESSMTSRGDAASADEAPMGDLTTLQESDSAPSASSLIASDDDDRTAWLWTSVALGCLAVAFAGVWVVLAKGGRQSSAS